MHKALKTLGIGVLAAGVPCLSAQAAQTSTTMAVTAVVLNVCTVAATPMVFGNVDPTGLLTTGTSLVTVICTLNQPYNVRMSQGSNGTAVTARKMVRTGGAELLSYNLFRDAARSLNWGETDGTDTLDDIGIVLPQLHTVYGSIPAGATVPAGIYTDSVTVTVDY